MGAHRRPGDRYGWLVVAAMLWVQTVSSGLGFYNMSVYVAELSGEMAQPLSALSFAVTLFFVVGGVTGIYVARLMERVSLRWIMVLGAVLAGLALAAVGLAEEVWHVYILFTLFGMGNTGVSLVVSTTLITRWFPGSNRAIALSVASTGLSVGGVTLTPLTAYLFNTIGVSATMPWLGLAFTMLIIPVVMTVVRLPDVDIDAGDNPGQQPAAGAVGLRERFFVLLSIGYIFCMGAQVGGIAHLYGRVESIAGFAVASMAVQALSVGSIVGRFAGGVIASRVSIRAYVLGALALQMLGLLLVAEASANVMAVVAAGVLGLSVGNLLMSQPLWLAEAFPGPEYPRVFALANALSVIGVASGPFLLGVLADVDSYRLAYWVATGLCIVAGIAFVSAGQRRAQRTCVVVREMDEG